VGAGNASGPEFGRLERIIAAEIALREWLERSRLPFIRNLHNLAFSSVECILQARRPI